MRKNTSLTLMALFGFCLLNQNCQKQNGVPSFAKPISLTIINALPTSLPVIPVINTSSPISYFNNAFNIGYGNFSEYSPPGGEDTVYIVQDNVDTLDIGSKSPKLLVYDIFNVPPGFSFSLYLTGADTNSPDYLFTRDTLLYHSPSDSSFGIRFVNLSAGSNAISIKLKGDSAGSQVSSLPYKGITSFVVFPANSQSLATYSFEFRDAKSGMLLNPNSSISLSGILNGTGGNISANKYRFKNFTIALIGLPGGSGGQAQKAIVINDY